jgi:NitT/TauT family transport system ATP-binding protein
VTEAVPIISLTQVCKSFGNNGADSAYTAVDRLDLEVGQGQMLALLGKTGCGKSTIFNMIAGLMAPTSGAVTVDGRNPFRDFASFRGRWRSSFRTIDCCRGAPRSGMSRSALRCSISRQNSA